jgi:hypothetical protein
VLDMPGSVEPCAPIRTEDAQRIFKQTLANASIPILKDLE